MATFTCNTGSVSVPSAAPASSSTAYMNLVGNSWTSSITGTALYSQWGLSDVTENTQSDGSSSSLSGSWNSTVGPMTADVTYRFRARIISGGTTTTGSTKIKKVGAVVSTASTPSASSITSTTATISCNYFPNVNESTCTAQLQYRKIGAATWTNAGSGNTTGGYSEVTSYSEALTGLTANTVYETRLTIIRTTRNDTTLTTSPVSFTTLAGAPTITTDTATNISSTFATLNSTLTINSGTGVGVYYVWDTANPPTANTTTTTSVSADGSYPFTISSLSASTTYYYRAYASFTYPSGSPASGSVGSFVSSAAPGATAAAQEHTSTYVYHRKYGVATSVYFPAIPRGNNDKFYTGPAPWDTENGTDVVISKDAGAFVALTTAPTHSHSRLYKVSLTAAEMQCTTATVHLHDTGSSLVRDIALIIRTNINLGSADIDAATGQKANTTAVKLTGYGSGHGLSATGGATGYDFDGFFGEHVLGPHTSSFTVTSATSSTVVLSGSDLSAANDTYNGGIIQVISGTGAGQARVVRDWVTATSTITVAKNWTTNPSTDSVCIILPPRADQWNTVPGAELAEFPNYAAAYAKLLQWIFQRVAYARNETVVVRTMYQADSATAIAQQGVDNDGQVEKVEAAVGLL